MNSWYEKNKEKHKANRRLYYQRNKERELTNVKAWKEANPDSQKGYIQKYIANNKDIIYQNQREYYSKNQEELRNKRKERYKNNKSISRAQVAKRRATKLNQTPKWADLKAIREFYINCPEGYHVDHIIPLQGKNVRGLHVLENLQYLPAIENVKKNNKFND